MSAPLKIDAKRALLGDEANVTGIFVRAQHEDGRWENVDIAALDKQSLLAWLKSRGGDNKWAEDVVGILLGHGHLHEVNDGS